jgi:paraquat-inducible protein A
MSSEQKLMLFICHRCSHTIAVVGKVGTTIICDRCGHKNHRLAPKSIEKTLAFSLTALILYVPANFFPFMSIELYGDHNTTTIWGGILSLANEGSWGIAIVVFLASILIPLLKLLILFYLSLTAKSGQHPYFKTKLFHIVESVGRWSMLDIFLLAVLVAVVKLSHWTKVTPELGSWLFLSVVIFTMLASSNFDPRLLWQENESETHRETEAN